MKKLLYFFPCAILAAGIANGTLAGETTEEGMHSMPSAISASDADFQARCSASGVTRCVGFDNTTTDIVPDVNVGRAGDGKIYGTLDTTVKTSGGGSLRFELPSGCSANCAGQWTELTPPWKGLGAFFGEGSTFYVQFRQRFSPEMLTNTTLWDSRWKQVAFYMNQVACAGIDLTTAHYNWSTYPDNFPIMYADCGARPLFNDVGTEIYLQQGDYNCPYTNTNATNCFYYPSNTWITFYYEVHVGTYGQPNSSVKAWVALPGQGYKQWINQPNWIIYMNNSHNDGFNNITLLPYMTRLTPVSTPTAYTWYDELIVSTQPIQAPRSSQDTQPPAPPTKFQVK